MNTILVVDGNSLVYRAFHAIPNLSTSQGIVTNAAYGFTTMLFKALKDTTPGLVAVAFDKGKITFRNEQYDGYKANRKATPEELRPQFILIKEILRAMQIKSYELAGYEADDLIGTIVTRAEKNGLNCLVLTGDRDALQLVSPKTKVLLTRKGITEIEVFDEGRVWEKFGVTPKQIIDLKGLTGDTSDNIPGVYGIGDKTAAKLIKEYGSVEKIIEHINELPSRQQNLMRGEEEKALLSKRLATIVTNSPMELELTECSWSGPDYNALLEVFKKLEFKSLIKQIIEGPKKAATQKAETADLSLPQVAAYQVGYKKLTDQPAMDRLVVQARQAGLISLSIDGTKELGIQKAAVTIEQEVFILPINQYPAALLTLKELCTDPAIKKYLHDAKPAILLLHDHHIPLAGLAFDTMVAAYLLNPTSPNHDLPDIALEHLHIVLPAAGDPALAASAESIARLIPLLDPKLKEQEADRLFYDIELPLIQVLADMEIAGITVDKNSLEKMSEELADKINHLTEEIFLLAGEEFNINSTKQMGTILFEKLKLRVIKKTKTGYSTDVTVLETLSEDHDIIPKILEYRQLVKLKSTYTDGLANLINPDTGKIHTTFHQTVTATGRLSSSEPNLQNIPVRMELGRKIRKVFTPSSSENLLLTADYSQIELRILAHISQDPSLLEAFQMEQDIHARTASEVFAVPLSEVTAELRSRAKAVNFGIVYGISDFGLARDIKVTRKEAHCYIESYFSRYYGVENFMHKIVKKAKEQGYVTTLFNRRRYLPDLFSTSRVTRNFGERTAINTPIQGTAADIIKLAMIQIYDELKSRNLKTKMLLQVHDELIFEVPENELTEVKELVRDRMENALVLDVPLLVDFKLGANWYDVKPILND